MLAQFVQEGSDIDHVPAADVAAGSVVVQGDLVGVAQRDIKAGELGTLTVGEAVFDLPKATTAGSAIPVGSKVYWDAVNNLAKTDDGGGTNKYLGKTILAAADADASVRVRLQQ